MKIIGAGFGRTGTLSLKTALEELGFNPCYHMVEVFKHREHADIWYAAAQGEPVNWRALLKEYQATVDWPGCTFYKELMEVYPEAKVLLTVRDPEKWYESAMSTIYQSAERRGLVQNIMGLMMPNMRRFVRMIKAVIWNGTFGGEFPDKAHAIAVFERHIEEVKRSVPAERLLIYNVKEGWEPLCAFLGVPVPSTPFPHINDREDFMARRQQRLRQNLLVSGVVLAGLLAALLLLMRQVGRQKLPKRG
ncbi:sulfotransferase family protein [Ktedonosporobacter rubrisoli]|uniref:Sulfotransferase family protein n=1 Tax=Ktedonosporobacter rubrisoli TaxID=2509675 RepID=A0A4V0Z0L2_KTERU|nr:sulfotransferase family protein [Ktedonosporobacter rubrisoli]